MPSYAVLTDTLLFDPIDIAGEHTVYRLEIYRRPEGYSALLLRLDSYRLKPSFLDDAAFHADEYIFVQDVAFFADFENRRFESRDDAIAFTQALLREKLCL